VCTFNFEIVRGGEIEVAEKATRSWVHAPKDSVASSIDFYGNRSCQFKFRPGVRS
jgi:hypothetical protein